MIWLDIYKLLLNPEKSMQNQDPKDALFLQSLVNCLKPAECKKSLVDSTARTALSYMTHICMCSILASCIPAGQQATIAVEGGETDFVSSFTLSLVLNMTSGERLAHHVSPQATYRLAANMTSRLIAADACSIC